MTSHLAVVIFSILLPYTTVINADVNFADKINIRVYSNGDSFVFEESPILDGVQMLEASPYFDANKPLVLLIHGMSMRAESGQIRSTINAFGQTRKFIHYNILAMHFPSLVINNWNNMYYKGVVANSEVIGGIIGDFFVEAIRKGQTYPSQVNMIGFCLGAHIAGYAARGIRQDYETPVEYIAGLDPAGFGYETIFGMTPISRRDARVVHLFHTNANYFATGSYHGTADFVFNGGMVQPGCRDDKLGCSHARAVSYFVESITNGEAFVARRCPSFGAYNMCLCNGEETKRISFPPDKSAIGEYYLMTRAMAPFGMGKAGSVCSLRTLVDSPWMLLAP